MDYIVSYKNPDIRIFSDINSLAEAFTSGFISEVSNQFLNRERVNIALSGGNTPNFFFQELVLFKEKLNWEKIFLFWGDERYVPQDHPESNYGMAKEYLLDHIEIPAKNVIRINGEAKPDDEVKRYSEIIRKNVPEVNGLPGFEIMILGLGEDGHTASIFPNQMELLNSDEICAVAYHPETKQERITLTGKVINNSKKIFFLVTGKNKSFVVSEIINEKGNYLKYPAYYIKPSNGEIVWFLDKGAASELNK
ncbi:MAG: 6-phosphogluconolactonase [Ignavibacteria bacterium RBG_16_34_14]|nr:MAG: 6-phosphogluconolactonase [Ignavibacteria bacterium RBG_16_34_14]